MTLPEGSLKTYGLAVAVLLIWGIIGYRIYVHLTADDVPDEPVLTRTAQRDPVSEILEMSFDYPDPFLSAGLVKPAVAKPVVGRRQANKIAAPLVGWDQFSYFGALYNTSKKNRTAAVRINGSEFFMSEGEEIGGFRLLKIFPDSVEVVNSKIIKYLRKASFTP